MKVGGDAQSAEVGHELADPIVVKVLDSLGAPVSGQIISWVVTAGGGHVFAPASLTNDSGIAKQRWTLGPIAGDSQALEARAIDNASGLPLVFGVFTATATPHAAAVLLPLGDSLLFTYPGDSAPITPLVQVKDSAGVPVQGATVSFALHNSPGTLSVASALTDTAGTVLSPTWVTGSGSAPESLVVSVAGVAPRVFVLFPITFTAVSARSGACAVTSSHHLLCWGNPGIVGGIVDGTRPSRIPTSIQFKAVATGILSACATSVAGAEYCWGSNNFGQVGDGTNGTTLTPVPVAGGHAFTSPSSTQYNTMCAIDGTQQAWCWGHGSHGQIGDSAGADRNAPAAVAGGHSFAAISNGPDHTCALAGNDSIYCWGKNSFGQLGSLGDSALVPTLVADSLHLFTALSAGGTHNCALSTLNDLYCWGSNSDGRLGDSTNSQQDHPVKVAGGHLFTQFSAGDVATCGVDAGGAGYCWGNGPLGDGTTNQSAIPIAVSGGLTFTMISVGDPSICGLTTSGRVYCWGDNNSGAVGVGPNNGIFKSPTLVVP